jgi:hypothetical protein
MSLNKLTTSTDYLQKQFLNIGCNSIKCSSLEVGGSPVTSPTTGKYDAPIAISVAGSDDLNGFVYFEKTNNQLRLSLSRLYQLGANASAIEFTIDFPPGYTATPFNGMAGSAYTTDGNHTSNATAIAADATGTKLVVSCNGSNNLASGNAYFLGNFVVEVL